MIKRTLYFGNPAYLKTKDEQLVVNYPDDEKPSAKVPIEDIGVVILDNYRITITQGLSIKLLENNVALITCDTKHMPLGLMLNLVGHHTQQERFSTQLLATESLKDKLWQQTIKAKILNQAALLKTNGVPVDNMLRWAKKTMPGDPDNFEARAAAYYWKYLFIPAIDSFKRGRFEEEPNNLLNYGYAILRAVVARSLVGSGLLPTWGIHHRNKYNAYCLADDIMEPYRPCVDRLVIKMIKNEEDIYILSPEMKKELLQLPVMDVLINGHRSPLMVAMQQTTASLYACFDRGKGMIKYAEIEL